MNDNPLGRDSDYPDTYSPALLCPLSRADGRKALGLAAADGRQPGSGRLPFRGSDLWTAWELSWLDPRGRPVVAILSINVPADSPNLVESKSLKLYLNSFAMSQFKSARIVSRQIQTDLEDATGGLVEVTLTPAKRKSTGSIQRLPGRCIDYEKIDCERYEVDPTLLRYGSDEVAESLHSHVLRSLCPVTGQPDTGSLLVTYEGPQIDAGSLLAYVTSFRKHSDFHELCVERIFCDLQQYCGARHLSVYARYNRRGGIDINPFRSNFEDSATALRVWRQ